MRKIRIVTVIGARPQFIKAAVLSRLIADDPNVEEIIVHTGQHFDSNMSKVFFQEMSIPEPKYNLNVNGLSHGAMTGQMLEKVEKIIIDENPDFVVVYGDTNSTLAGALAAKKLHVKVVHIEAGLRSHNMEMPEEINRILTDRISDILFCPTQEAVNNLYLEGYDGFKGKIFNVGDIMLDAALYYSEMNRSNVIDLPNNFALCTVHREENTDKIDCLLSIMKALEMISTEVKIIFPLHPRTRKKLELLHYNFADSNIQFFNPIGYQDMMDVLSRCEFVLTDSGGLQKEAFFFKKHCLVLRDETEWNELIENGYNFLVGANKDNIIKHFQNMGTLNEKFDRSFYGNGMTGTLILNILKEYANE